MFFPVRQVVKQVRNNTLLRPTYLSDHSSRSYSLVEVLIRFRNRPTASYIEGERQQEEKRERGAEDRDRERAGLEVTLMWSNLRRDMRCIVVTPMTRERLKHQISLSWLSTCMTWLSSDLIQSAVRLRSGNLVWRAHITRHVHQMLWNS